MTTDELRAIAQAAKEDAYGLPWWDTEQLADLTDLADNDDPISMVDRAHIAAWSPDRALAALGVIEAAAWCTDTRDISEEDANALRDALKAWEDLP